MVKRWGTLTVLLALWVAPAGADTTRIVTDLVGRKVAVPARIERVACLVATSYEKLLLLGQGDKVALAAPADPQWSARIDRHRPTLAAVAHSQSPNIEDLLLRKIDVIFYRNDPPKVDKMTAAGLTAVVSLAFGGQPGRKVDSVDAFVRIVKDEVRLYGDVLGGNAVQAANDWIVYYDAKIKYVRGRIADVPLQQRPRVYGALGPTSTRSYGQRENSLWYVEMAGGRMVTKELTESGGIDVSMEQIMLWNPDMVFIGHTYSADAVESYSTDMVTKDPRWQNIRAVRDGKVFALPVGVDAWENDSEGVLLMEYLAKKFYPDRFADLDMVAEVKDYYARFYHYRLTDDEARGILNGATRLPTPQALPTRRKT